MPSYAMLIELEGGDACGKGTQAQLLCQALKAMGFKVELFSFPNYETKSGQKVAAFLRGEMPGLSCFQAAALYSRNRFEDKERLAAALRKNDFVVCNRYVWSNAAYQSAGLKGQERRDFLIWLEGLEFEQLRLPQPNLVIFFDVPPKISHRLLFQKTDGRGYLQGQKADQYEKNLAFQRQVYANYRCLARERKWATIVCAKKGQFLSPEEISQMVLEIIKGKFPQRFQKQKGGGENGMLCY